MVDMSNATPTVGTELEGVTRTFTMARRRWYSAGLRSAAIGNVSQAMMGGIHDDDDYARAQGMKAPIIDGMTVTNWCSSLLVKHFGLDYVGRGSLRTKYIKPTYMGEKVTVRAKVVGSEPAQGGGTLLKLDVWCENQDGVKVTDGEATVVVGT